MTNSGNSEKKASADAAPTRSAEGIVRIEHDRRRLALAALAGGVAALVLPCLYIAGNLHPARAAVAWTLAPLSVAILLAAVGFVRNIVRLQDGDPALVLSPRGLDFRPYLFGEIVRIPWTAIRGFKARSYKQNRFIVLQVDDVDRYAPRIGLPGFLRRTGRRRLGVGEISFSAPMSKPAWNELEALLHRYLEQHGRPDATSASASPGGARASVVGLTAKSLHSRSPP